MTPFDAGDRQLNLDYTVASAGRAKLLAPSGRALAAEVTPCRN